MTPPEILALHGNLGSTRDWEALDLPGLRAVDLWEHSSLSFFEMAHEVATSLSGGMEKPILAGYSLGGRIALHAMAIHPDRWTGAIIASAHPGLSLVNDRAARRESDDVWAGHAREMPWGDFLRKWNEQGVLATGEASDDQLALENQRQSVALAFETWSLGRQDDLRRNLRGFTAPVLWVSGETDEKFRAIGEEMKDVFSRFEHFVIPRCGHRVLRSPCLTDEISRWITCITSSSST
ncbi:MAG: alpha/beta fold hydrolase [Verrucomicrobiales bacterium]|nr:alpha/beta fold hydrolase [Verrucomicrobiales bacterium]